MPFPTAVAFLLVLCVTALAGLCLIVGLSLFAVRRYKAVAPYVTLVYPAAYFGGAIGVATAWRLNALVDMRQGWALGIVTAVFITCLVGGAGIFGFLGYALAYRIAKHLVCRQARDARGD